MDREELGAALRGWRARLSPAEVGLAAGLRRRTPGLRREEVAQLAGVSVDYVVRLEQARGPHPSASVLGALARALRLSAAENAHLHALAGVDPPGPLRVPSAVRPSVLRLMDRMADLPVVLLDARKDVLAWNAMAAALLGDLSTVPVADRNLAWLHFGRDDADLPGTFVGARLAAVGEERERLDRATVGELRSAAARYPDDERLARLVAALRSRSATFARLWSERSVEPRRGDRKSYLHPTVGELTLDCDVLTVPEDDQSLVVHSAAPGTPAAEALALLRVLGTQDMTTGVDGPV